jgi:alcohol dehydrogenase
MLLKTVLAGKVQPKQLITHHFELGELLKAYETFENANEEKTLKVIIRNEGA